MKFSTGWFSRLLHFSRSKTGEFAAVLEDVQHEADATEPSTAPTRAGLRERLLGMVKRRKTGKTGDEPGQPVEESQTEVLPEAQPILAVVSEEVVEGAAEIGSETSNPGLWTRLLGMFRRRPKTDEVGAEADATELFSWGEGEQPATEQAVQAAGIGSSRRKQAEDRESAEEGEEPPEPGLGSRIRKLFKKKIVVLALLLGTIIIVIATSGLLLYQQRQQEKVQLEALVKKNKQLEAENRKLQASKPKPVAAPHQVTAKPAGHEASLNGGSAADQGAGKQAGSSADDCTVNNKANAADVLKRCIENFNAADRR